MPYKGEHAGKGGHLDFLKNPDVERFLQCCSYLQPPSKDQEQSIALSFFGAPTGNEPLLPKQVIASDASKSDAPIDKRLPSTQVGFLKISHVLVNLDQYHNASTNTQGIVDPLKVAQLHREAHPLTFVMPGSNIKYAGCDSVKSGFRQALFDHMQIRMGDNPNSLSLAQLLAELNPKKNVILIKCPCCGADEVFVFNKFSLFRECRQCLGKVFITDDLRLHEGISDFGDNSTAMTRMMNSVEHLMLVGLIWEMFSTNPKRLSDVSFVVDGPLAVFGEPAKISQRLQRMIHKVNSFLDENHLRRMLVIGLQKTGGLMDHAQLIKPYIPPNTMRVVDDQYRHTYITGAESPSANFGNETYYGQDFLFKTEKGNMFNFSIPYPFEDKTFGGGGAGFAQEKIKWANYGTLIRQACDFIRYFEMDMYQSAVVPVALAHRHASISLTPGGKVLDVLAKTNLQKNLGKHNGP